MRSFQRGIMLASLILGLPKVFIYGKDHPTKIFRFYEDNDFLNIRGNGTDKAYTNGVRLDLFYNAKDTNRNFVQRLLPVAGAGSVNIYGWSLMQVMVTPKNLTIPTFQKDDYPYSGSLFISHSMASYNPSAKRMVQSEVVLGIRGPASFARQTQVGIHRLINDEIPMGWKNQCDSKVLININCTTEKLFHHFRKCLEIIGGATISAGTMCNSVAVYPLLRFGLMNPYFEGLFAQFGNGQAGDTKKKKVQCYLIAKPKVTFVATNSIMSGDIHTTLIPKQDHQVSKVNHYVAEINFGLVITRGNAGISYTQKPTTAYNKGLYGHNVGNISLYFNW